MICCTDDVVGDVNMTTTKEKRSACIGDLRYIALCLEYDDLRRNYASRLCHLGLIELCQYIYLRNFFVRSRRRDVGRPSTGNGNGKGSSVVRTVERSSDSDEDGEVDMQRMYELELALGLGVNMTDDSVEACRRVVDVGLYRNLFAMLRDSSMDPEVIGSDFGDWHNNVADNIMSILYNVVQVRILAVEKFQISVGT
jgi:hypothetical protein